jgi:hypothetical protein
MTKHALKIGFGAAAVALLLAALAGVFTEHPDRARAQISAAGIKLVPLGYQQISTPAVATPLTVPAGANYVYIQVDTQAIRWRDDGTAPTAAIGMQVPVGGTLFYAGTLSAFQLIQVTAGAVVNVSYYRGP